MDYARTIVILVLVSMLFTPFSIGQESEQQHVRNPSLSNAEYLARTLSSGYSILVSQNQTHDDENTLFRVYLIAQDWGDIDEDGIEGNDNLADVLNPNSINIMPHDFLGLEILGRWVRIIRINTDPEQEPYVELLRADKTTHYSDRTTEYHGYRITRNYDGSDYVHLEIAEPNGNTQVFSVNYNHVQRSDEKHIISKEIGNLTIAVLNDCNADLPTAEFYLLIGEYGEKMNAEMIWDENDITENPWRINAICCERSRNGTKELEAVVGTSNCDSFTDLETSDGRTCMIEFITNRLDIPESTTTPSPTITPSPIPTSTVSPSPSQSSTHVPISTEEPSSSIDQSPGLQEPLATSPWTALILGVIIVIGAAVIIHSPKKE